MVIIPDYIPIGWRNRPGVRMVPRYITIHDTANPAPGANARGHGEYLRNAGARLPVSWHFTVDDREVRQHLPLDEVGWHAGDGRGPGNYQSIGIEICENSDGDRAQAERHAASLAALLIASLPSLGGSVDCLRQHYDWTGKNCPHLLRSRPQGWANFTNLVSQQLTGLPKDVPPDHWAVDAILWVLQEGIMTGYPDGRFDPDGLVTRAQLAAVLYRLFRP